MFFSDLLVKAGPFVTVILTLVLGFVWNELRALRHAQELSAKAQEAQVVATQAVATALREFGDLLSESIHNQNEMIRMQDRGMSAETERHTSNTNLLNLIVGHINRLGNGWRSH